MVAAEPARRAARHVALLLAISVCVNNAEEVGGQVAVQTPTLANEVGQVSETWNGKTVNDLFGEYGNIFRHGNRNAASHLWVQFLLQRSHQMSVKRLDYFFSGFCAVSGSPVRPSDYNRYLLRLDRVDGTGKVAGFMHYCCWPCVCDTQDFIKVDTRTVSTAEGERKLDFAVIGNPCDHEAELHKPFKDAFGRGMSTLHRDAPEVRCRDGVLQGAPLSDHGYVIIARFFETPSAEQGSVAVAPAGAAQPGRVTEISGTKFQDEAEYKDMCTQRAMNGYNSGMGEIFRRVAKISPIIVGKSSPKQIAQTPKDVLETDSAPDCDDPSGATCVPPKEIVQ